MLLAPVFVATSPASLAETWVETLLAPAAAACALAVVPAISPARAAPTSIARVVAGVLGGLVMKFLPFSFWPAPRRGWVLGGVWEGPPLSKSRSAQKESVPEQRSPADGRVT